MTEAKHTPGPWMVIPRGESSGRSVGTIEPKPETMIGPNYWTVAEVNSRREQWEHNLRLIAAAPELLEALEVLMELERRGRLMPIGREWDMARAAIAKATGSAA